MAPAPAANSRDAPKLPASPSSRLARALRRYLSQVNVEGALTSWGLSAAGDPRWQHEEARAVPDDAVSGALIPLHKAHDPGRERHRHSRRRKPSHGTSQLLRVHPVRALPPLPRNSRLATVFASAAFLDASLESSLWSFICLGHRADRLQRTWT